MMRGDGAPALQFKLQTTRKIIEFAPKRVIIAGYTGRNQDEVRAHVRELAAQGIPAPAEIPTIFRATRDRLTTHSEIEVLGRRTTGEAEVVLLVGKKIWVAVGSDHTDRELEMTNIAASKQACPKPVSSEVWDYSEVRGRWDDLVLRSWVGAEGREQVYQEARMAALLRPEELLELLRTRLGSFVDESAIYTGTIPLIGGAFAAAPYFESELFDPTPGRSLKCFYRVSCVV